MMNVLINSMVEILSQCICRSNNQVVYFKYSINIFVNCTSIKLKKKNTKKQNQWVIVSCSIGVMSCMYLVLDHIEQKRHKQEENRKTSKVH